MESANHKEIVNSKQKGLDGKQKRINRKIPEHCKTRIS
jgi:hypothetical protein